MSKIRIKNFGPIKEGYHDDDGWLDIKKVTVFIGNQGSGKSTMAKLISMFTWIEKALVRGDYDEKWFTRRGRFKNQFLTYHRLENYFPGDGIFDSSIIEYEGDAYTIRYVIGQLEIKAVENRKYPLPQIMYVPAERNFISNVKTPKALKLTSDSLIEYVTEFDNAKLEMKGSLRLPVNQVDVEYDKLNDVVNIKGKDYKLRLTEASSGFQSLVPLYLVSWYLSNSVKLQSENTHSPSSEELDRFRKGVTEIYRNESLTEEQRRIAISVLASKFNKSAFINIVEEPEQNLFPTSQWQMLKSLLEFNNMNQGNKLIMTTHSPYIVNYLNIAVQGHNLKEKIAEHPASNQLTKKLSSIVPLSALCAPDDLVVYQLDESDGTIKKLANFEGVITDKNYLNQIIRQGNELFDSLLEIEEEL
ncbi:MAG: ATP-binding protein [Saprospiraceae bacterium]|nr:ATP-binding protein [Saprospiraceae bacterium]